MRRFRLKFFDPDVMDYKYLLPCGTRGSTTASWQAGEYTTAELEHTAKMRHVINAPGYYVAAAILAAIESGHLTKEYV